MNTAKPVTRRMRRKNKQARECAATPASVCLLRRPRKTGTNTSGWSISRILSGELHRFTLETEAPSSFPAARFSDHPSMQSTRDLSSPKGQEERAAPSSLFDLALDGGCLAAHIAVNAGGLLHHLFTITGTEVPAVVFCGPIRQITPSRDFPGAVPCRVRTFLDHARGAAAIAQPA